MGSSIEGILFDFGGTLYDFDPPSSVIWSRIAGRLGVDIPPEDPRIWEGMRRLSVEAAGRAQPFSKLSQDEIHGLNILVLSAMGVDGECVREIIGEEFDRRGHGYRINPETRETIKRIHSMGLKIGLLSNCPPDFVRPRRRTLEGDGLLRYFSSITLSAESDHAKPKREIFETAVDSLGLQDPSQVIHVGDSLLAEVMGAQNAGLIPVLYDQFGFHSGEQVITIRKLPEIFRHLT